MNYYFVNQGKTYKEEKEGRFLWAPFKDKRGSSKYFWETMEKLKRGDVIFSNVNGYITSLNVVVNSWEKTLNPFDNEKWINEGRRVNLIYFELDSPIRYDEHISFILENDTGAFDVNGKIKQGYLFELNEALANYFLKLIDNNLKSKFLKFRENLLSNDIEEQFGEIEELSQFKEINDGTVGIYSDVTLDLMSKSNYNYLEEEKVTKSKRVKTDPILKSTRLAKSNYLCEVNSEHQTFTNSKSNHQYLECHHLIPVKAQKDYPNIRLDCIENLISLCPICHAQFHYGNKAEKRKVFDKIVDLRIRDLQKIGFDYNELGKVFNKYY